MLCQRARQLLAPPRGPLSAIGGIDSLRHAEAGCQTQASDSPALPHRLPPVSISAAVVGRRPARRNRVLVLAHMHTKVEGNGVRA